MKKIKFLKQSLSLLLVSGISVGTYFGVSHFTGDKGSDSNLSLPQEEFNPKNSAVVEADISYSYRNVSTNQVSIFGIINDYSIEHDSSSIKIEHSINGASFIEVPTLNFTQSGGRFNFDLTNLPVGQQSNVVLRYSAAHVTGGDTVLVDDNLTIQTKGSVSPVSSFVFNNLTDNSVQISMTNHHHENLNPDILYSVEESPHTFPPTPPSTGTTTITAAETNVINLTALNSGTDYSVGFWLTTTAGGNLFYEIFFKTLDSNKPTIFVESVTAYNDYSSTHKLRFSLFFINFNNTFVSSKIVVDNTGVSDTPFTPNVGHNEVFVELGSNPDPVYRGHISLLYSTSSGNKEEKIDFVVQYPAVDKVPTFNYNVFDITDVQAKVGISINDPNDSITKMEYANVSDGVVPNPGDFIELNTFSQGDDSINFILTGLSFNQNYDLYVKSTYENTNSDGTTHTNFVEDKIDFNTPSYIDDVEIHATSKEVGPTSAIIEYRSESDFIATSDISLTYLFTTGTPPSTLPPIDSLTNQGELNITGLSVGTNYSIRFTAEYDDATGSSKSKTKDVSFTTTYKNIPKLSSKIDETTPYELRGQQYNDSFELDMNFNLMIFDNYLVSTTFYYELEDVTNSGTSNISLSSINVNQTNDIKISDLNFSNEYKLTFFSNYQTSEVDPSITGPSSSNEITFRTPNKPEVVINQGSLDVSSTPGQATFEFGILGQELFKDTSTNDVNWELTDGKSGIVSFNSVEGVNEEISISGLNNGYGYSAVVHAETISGTDVSNTISFRMPSSTTIPSFDPEFDSSNLNSATFNTNLLLPPGPASSSAVLSYKLYSDSIFIREETVNSPTSSMDVVITGLTRLTQYQVIFNLNYNSDGNVFSNNKTLNFQTEASVLPSLVIDSQTNSTPNADNKYNVTLNYTLTDPNSRILSLSYIFRGVETSLPTSSGANSIVLNDLLTWETHVGTIKFYYLNVDLAIVEVNIPFIISRIDVPQTP